MLRELPNSSLEVMEAEALTSAEHFGSVAESHHHSFEVRWFSGEIAYRYDGKKDLCLERLMQDFDEGLIKDVPSAHIDENGRWLTHYRLYWGTVEMVEGQRLSDYNMPPNTTLTLALVPVINV